MKVKIIKVAVKPADFKKLQADVSDKQKAIDKLQLDLTLQQEASVALAKRVDVIENKEN